MFISKQLKEQNIAEYVLYMWQVEDLVRAAGLDMERIEQTLVAPYGLDEAQRKGLTQWYDGLIEMMRFEGVTEKGHLQVVKNTVILLTDLHNQLLASTKLPYYRAAYYKALPFIVELRAKHQGEALPELETAFEALYGVMMLRLQKREVSEQTTKAVKEISSWLSMLAGYYIKDKQGELDELL